MPEWQNPPKKVKIEKLKKLDSLIFAFKKVIQILPFLGKILFRRQVYIFYLA
jgi:hypothetical protein